MNIRRFFKRVHVKMMLKVRKGIRNRNFQMTEHEEICFEIFRKNLYAWNSKLFMSPKLTNEMVDNSNQRFIIIGDQTDPDLAIIITFPTINIVNHQFNYPVEVNKNLYTKMVDMFDRKIMKERNAMENAIYKNITNGLQNLSK